MHGVRIGVLASGSGTILEAICEAGLPVVVVVVDRPCRATEVAAFSSRGPAADGRIKPDLVAPGTAVISTASGLVGSEFKPNPRYAVLSGTSQATAVAAGAVPVATPTSR